MASQFSQLEGSINIYFVVSKEYDNENDCSEDMWEAYQKCDENQIPPQWKKEEDCSNLEVEKTDIFVFEKFEGEIFEKLKTTKCFRILGPKCLLRCFLTNEQVPAGTSPVLNTAMRDNIICFSGLDPSEKLSLQQKIEYMGGICMKQLRHCVTHLITDSVMSAKYEKSIEDDIKVFTKDWIKAVWESNINDFIHANDKKFDKFKAPVFMNLIVTSTNLTKLEKDEVKKLINKNGGEYMGPLDGHKVKIVIAKEYTSMSEKIKYAMANNIACLSIDWIRKSVEAGHSLPFNDYLIKPSLKDPKCSTPERESQLPQATLNFSTISCIPRDPLNNVIDETLSSTMSISTTASGPERTEPNYTAIVDQLTIKEAKNAGPFLDGCNIYLSGFSGIHRDRINKILNVGSATRYDEISETITHVIIGDSSKASADLKIIQSKGINPHILSINWLEESIKLKKPAPEEIFAFDKKEEIRSEPQSPLSKKNLQMLQKPKRPPVPIFKITDSEHDKEEQELLKQYTQPTISDQSITRQEFNFNKSKTINNLGNESEIPFSQTSTTGAQIFTGLTFFVTGFDDEMSPALKEEITGLGGTLLSNSFTGIPDFAIVPLTVISLKQTANEIVTNFFIEDCLDNDKVVDIKYYHRPICIPEDVKPLSDCVIVISSYSGLERAYLSKLSMALGARHQDTFAKRTNLEKGLYGGTHLICTTPEGNKYNAAVKWKLPAVTAEWLKVCAEKLMLINEIPYLVGETVAPERENQSENLTPMILSNRQIFTPKRFLNVTTNSETPIINKRLSLNNKNDSIKSPFHFATPETPYGQVFNENPSPSTRKAWGKWIEGCPDKKIDENPSKRRKLSTPLSEIKRQLWSALKKPNSENDDNHDSIDNPDDTEKSVDTEINKINRELTFNDDTPKNVEIDQELQQLDKLLKATSSSSNEERFSIHGEEREKITEHCDVPATQVESVGWEDPHPTASGKKCDKLIVEADIHVSKKFKFMLSGIKDRESYENLIKLLGGEVSEESVFDNSASHLLCVRPSRNEKMLGSIASGKWILHCSYLRACEKAGKFIDEEIYEWGNPRSDGIIPEAEGENERSMIAAAHRWRLHLENSDEGAFYGMIAILLVNQEKYEMFERLINAGGGIVVQAKPPYDSSPGGKKITHCFVTNRSGQPVDWAMLASKGILCFQPQFLNLLLTSTECINQRDHVIQEFKKYLALLPK